MKVPLSWLKDFVDLTLDIPELAHRMTLAGLEVEEIRFAGLPIPPGRGAHGLHETKVTGLGWDPDKIVVGEVLEVMPHPNADRLVLCRLQDGLREHVVLTGAPNLFDYKGKGPLSTPLKVAYAREGAQLYDGHKPGAELMTLKRSKIRGVESYSMACSEKELGISDEHEGIILLDADAPTGMPLAEYMGDAVFEIAITPNMARNANILGVAREVAALTGAALKLPSYDVAWDGPPIAGRVTIAIQEPELNPRFVLGLIEGVTPGESPYWVQRRLRLAGMRPINNIVDATNYAMLEIGEPLHAFDFDVLKRRAGGRMPEIVTRLPAPGERLTTLDGADRALDDFTVLVADSAGALSIAGVMGGAESEVSASTRNVLVEGAAWDFINIRRTLGAHKLSSEAAYRFSRGVHPAMAERGVRRGLMLMHRLAGGSVAEGLVDAYPLPPEDPVVELTPQDTQRWLGIRLEPAVIADLLRRLDFSVTVEGETVHARVPDHRLDIGTGIVGQADLVEEIARLHGYDRIPETMINDPLPSQHGNPALEREDLVRDSLVRLGLQEVITYRLTSTEREARRLPEGTPADPMPYIQLANPMVADRVVMRHSLLASVLEIVERNARVREHVALFEIGPVFLAAEDEPLPLEVARLVIVLSGRRDPATWQAAEAAPMDFYDLKGVLQSLLQGLHIVEVKYEPAVHPSFHPGKCAQVSLQGQVLGVFGELHPNLRRRYEMPEAAVLAADLDLGVLLSAVPARHEVVVAPPFPPVLEDLAIVVDEGLPAEAVEVVLRQAAGALLAELRLFDLYRGESIGAGKKSLAYALTYQAQDRTLTDSEVAALRAAIVRALGQKLGAQLRT
ncbi:MAG: phenylalanine--tRNA ligase subunit beta [Anaerolineales bacterium]|nr:phenylalanine--tRNA ligase subunit beta [Anaerolineales bacterium]